MKKPKNSKIAPQEIAQASAQTLIPSATELTKEEFSALELEVAWLHWRSDFRKAVVGSGQLRAPWRNIFEADAIFCLIAHRWLTATPITLKEVATYLSEFTTEATISRHIDDMEYAGMLKRTKDPADNRRLLLVPTERLLLVGRSFLQGRIAVMKKNGFTSSGAPNE
ncbi:MarR family transcriptional regulator [Microvirga sp. CF3062]|uniref:MarR family transcriptional regulator n=1 Tax=Microvirga sp. CF3062 TaxID=3110182 RepID=UPI002E75D284|nr:MarR family transcriptional regulator [Microvirga sp. CF3062]MEE1656939.1 MarR family transcriptional regulator [Microvirga sp. CF3062]